MKAEELGNLNHSMGVESMEFMPKRIYEKGSAVWVQILAYMDARAGMDLLDLSCGPGDWQTEYKRDSKGILQCGIGIFVERENDIGTWVWKWSNGTPSTFEPEKGEYSDAFKRACFMWGVGRCLYEMPDIYIQLEQTEYYEKDGKKHISQSGFRINNPLKWKWEVSKSYDKIVAQKKYGNSWKTRFDSNPYKK